VVAFVVYSKKVALKVGTKGKDLSESGKQKQRTPFLLKIQILNCKWQSHLPNERKNIRFALEPSKSLGYFF